MFTSENRATKTSTFIFVYITYLHYGNRTRLDVGTAMTVLVSISNVYALRIMKPTIGSLGLYRLTFRAAIVTFETCGLYVKDVKM